MPENVGAGEKVYVVVDGVAYLVVNDDGSDIGSSSNCLSSDGLVNKHPSLCDDLASADGSTLPVSRSSSNIELPVPESQAQLVPELGEMLSDSSGTTTGDELTGSSSVDVNVSQNSDIISDSQPRTVLAENDDEFEHLTSEFPDKPASSDTGVSKPNTFVSSFLGFVCAGKNPSIRGIPFERPRLPKFVVQVRPQLRLSTPGTSNTVPTVRPLTVVTPSPVSSPQKHTVTTIIKSSPPRKLVEPAKPADQKAAESVVKSTVASNDAVEKTKAVAAVKPNRQPRVLKRMPLCCVIFARLFMSF